MRIARSAFEVLAVDGDSHLGRRHFDDKLIKFCLKKFDPYETKKPQLNSKMMRLLLTFCEQAKRDLSALTEVDMIIDNFYKGEDLIVRSQRSEFEAECADLFGRVLPPLQNALDKCRMRPGDIDAIWVVGGSSNLPKVRELLGEFFPGKDAVSSMTPIEAVVRGAVIIAARKKPVGELSAFDIRDASTFHIRVSVLGDRPHHVIEMETLIPAQGTESFTVTTAGQNSIVFEMIEGISGMASKGGLLGKITVTGIPPAEPCDQSVELMLSLDEGKVLTASAVVVGAWKIRFTLTFTKTGSS
jgi:L1 cell adhesion molecule like protein